MTEENRMAEDGTRTGAYVPKVGDKVRALRDGSWHDATVVDDEQPTVEVENGSRWRAEAFERIERRPT